MIRHGQLSQTDAERLSATMQTTEDNKRRLDGLQPMDVVIIPAKFTGGLNGAHAWTRQRIDATGGRYDDPLTFTGVVSGVSSATVTWQPARLPGTTGVLSGLPVYGYVTPIGLTPSTGPNFEVLVIPASSSSLWDLVGHYEFSGTSPSGGTVASAIAVSATTAETGLSLSAGTYVVSGNSNFRKLDSDVTMNFRYAFVNVTGTAGIYTPEYQMSLEPSTGIGLGYIRRCVTFNSVFVVPSEASTCVVQLQRTVSIFGTTGTALDDGTAIYVWKAK